MRLHLANFLVLTLLAGLAPAAQEELRSDLQMTPGLPSFVEARMLQASGRYREAVQAYDRAVEQQPSVTEIRVQYAALLVELGLAKRAVDVLDAAGELDWYGRRVRALALARYSGQDPGSLGDAEAALRLALEERDDDPNLQLSLAQVLHRAGKIDEAEEIIAMLREARDGSVRLVAYHARLLEALDRGQEAAELYAQCAAADFGAGQECRQKLVELLVELGRPGEAGEIMLRWLDDDELDQRMRAAGLLYEGGRYEEALRTVRQVLREAPDSPRALTLEAYVLSSMNRFDEAAATFRRLLRSDRENVEFMLALAWATANSGDQEEARRWIDKAWARAEGDEGSPLASRVALTAARIELFGGNNARAREWLGQVSDYGNDGEQVVFLLAESYRRDENWTDGIAALLRLQPRLEEDSRQAAVAFEAEFRLRTGDSRAWKLLRPLFDGGDRTDVLLALQVLQGLERWEEVDVEAAAALQRFPDDRRIQFARAASLERLGKTGEAEVLFRGLVEDDPNDAAAANYLGYTWANRGENLDEALKLITRAVEIDPGNPAYLDSLGWVHYRLGDLDQAEFWLRRAVGYGGVDGTILSHLGEVLLEMGASDEGRQLLRRALDVGCDNPERVQELLDRKVDIE
jgi:tetratricopeptide (TPR) repeat protein